jgi:hypothetical protein
MARRVQHPKLAFDDLGNALARPKVTARAEGFSPCANTAGSCARCSVDNRLTAPGTGRLYSASTLSSRVTFSHWLTAPSDTPNASAIRFCFQPALASSYARRRRASFQSFGSLGFSCAIPSVYFVFTPLCPPQ